MRSVSSRLSTLALAAGTLLTSLTFGSGPASAASAATWDKLAECESGGNWAESGAPYYGGLQFSLSTWQSVGGTDFAAYPNQATREEQILVGERLLDSAGENQWPVCGPKVGLGSDPGNPVFARQDGIGMWDPSNHYFHLRNAANAGGNDAGDFVYGGDGMVPLSG
ncbi:transglycosylase family protein, partial [Streptomyces sp. NPDC056549]|uniref:transglycosylase family protein n=1 Tax=Streptomyces sp. NPDC056549 TaxID=3345864 RepID=UPI0036A0B3C6